MESIRNAVFGTRATSEEPLSGQTGNVAQGEPYDAGNIAEQNEVTNSDTNATSKLNATHGNTVGPDTTVEKTESVAPGAVPTSISTSTPATNPIVTTSNSTPATNPTVPTSDSIPAANSGTTTGTTTGSQNSAPAVNPAATVGSSTTAADSTAAQGDVRDPSDPQTKPEIAQRKENVDDSTAGLDTDDNPAKVDGPGPRSVAELARERGGDAGATSKSSGGETLDPAGAPPASKEATKQEEKEEIGPDVVVKTTGLAADGGDFDATKPGAGTEADRLLHEMGVHVDKPKDTANVADGEGNKAGTGDAEVTKPKLTDRIKAKFHKS